MSAQLHLSDIRNAWNDVYSILTAKLNLSAVVLYPRYDNNGLSLKNI